MIIKATSENPLKKHFAAHKDELQKTILVYVHVLSTVFASLDNK